MTPWVRAAKELEETLNSATESSGHTDSLDSTYDSAFYSSFAPSTSSICSSPGLAPISTDTRSSIPSAAAINTKTLSHLSYSQPTYHLLPTVIATKTSEYNASLRPRTPLEVVALSNLKLNNDIFSKRSLSIRRRVLVKNLLTLLYEINPMLDWIENSSSLSGALGVPASDNSVSADPPLAEDKQNGRIEQSLYAAGVNGEDGRQPSQELTDADRVTRRPWSRGDSKDHNNSTASLAWTAQRSSGEQNTRDVSSPATLRATVVPLPRPKSSELPQSLHSYLSAVFDVDWSVAHSSSEDSLFTSAGSTPSLSSAALSPLSTFSLGTSSAGSSSLAGARSTLSDGYLSSSTVPPSKTSFPRNPAIVTAKDSNQSHKGQRGLSGAPGEALSSLSERLAVRVTLVSPSTTPYTHKKSADAAGRGTGPNTQRQLANKGLKLTPDSSTPVIRKSTIVPGRRSSLAHPGQLISISSPSTNMGSRTNGGTGNILDGGAEININNNAGNNITNNSANNSKDSKNITPVAAGSSVGTGKTHVLRAILPPQGPTGFLSAATESSGLDAGAKYQDGQASSPSFSRRTSSLLHAEQTPRIDKSGALESSLSTTRAESPLSLSVSLASGASTGSTTPTWTFFSLNIGHSSEGVDDNRPSSHSMPISIIPVASGPKVTTSMKARRQVSSELDSPTNYTNEHIPHHSSRRPHLNGIHVLPPSPPLKSSYPGMGEYQVGSRSPPQAPRQLTISPPAFVSVPQRPLPVAPVSPPRSPARLSPPAALPNAAPVLPPLFPPQNEAPYVPPPNTQQLHQQYQQQYQRQPNQPQQHQQQQQQHSAPRPPALPSIHSRPISDKQIPSRFYNGGQPTSSLVSLPISPPLSPPPSPSMSARPSPSQRLKNSRSSPDLKTASVVHFHNFGTMQRPLPALPTQYQPQEQQQPRQHQQQWPDKSFKIAERTSSKDFHMPSTIDTHLTSYRKHDGPGMYSDGREKKPTAGNNRWTSVKSMLGLKIGQNGK